MELYNKEAKSKTVFVEFKGNLTDSLRSGRK